MTYPPLWLRILLWPLSLLYGWVTRVRRSWYERGFLTSYPLPGQVISIGNIEAGGTGKSPMTLELCRVLKSQGAEPVILTRGYKSGLSPNESAVIRGEKVILPAQNTITFVADEARMQAANLGDIAIVIGSDRYSAAKRYLEHFPAPSHWILDDGFQHQRIRRNIDIVLLDAERPFDNGHTLPAGLLRERKSSLTKADWIIFTRAHNALPHDGDARWLEEHRLPYSAVEFISGAPHPLKPDAKVWNEVTAWTLALGVAKPERIIEGLKGYQLPIKNSLLAPDHETFDKSRLEGLLQDGSALLLTAKDYWREKQYFDQLQVPVYLIPLTVEWRKGRSFPEILQSLTENLPSHF